MNIIGQVIAQIPSQRKKKADGFIILTVIVLCVFGLLMIWSASMYDAKTNPDLNYDEFYYVKRQLKFFGLGLVIMMFVSVLKMDLLKRISPLILTVMLGILTFMLLKPDEDAVNGAIRYIVIAGIPIQPSEFTKIAVLMFMSYLCELMKSGMKTLKAFLIVMIFMGITFYVIYKQPAMSTAAIVAALFLGIYLAAGGNVTYLAAAIVLLLIGSIAFINFNEWRADRIFAWLDPWADIRGTGWQPAQSLMALGSGGLFGRGIGNGMAKLNFLPEAQNDYIFSIIGEELGFLGCTVLIAVFCFLIIRLFVLAFTAKDMFSRLFCAGAAILFSVQVFLNVAVCTNLSPSTGVVLPFVSYGGSSMISYMMIIGMVLNISRNNPIGGMSVRRKTKTEL